MRNQDDVQLIIDIASTWVLQADASGCAQDTYGVWCDGLYLHITAQELALVDARLALVFNHIISRLNGGLKNFNGDSVRHTQRFWNGELLCVDGPSSALYIVHTVTAIQTPFGIDNNIVFLEGTFSSGTEVPLRFPTLSDACHYIEPMHEKTIPVLASWMTQEYPGWRERLTLLQAIGVSADETVAQVMVKPMTTPAITMHALEFGKNNP